MEKNLSYIEKSYRDGVLSEPETMDRCIGLYETGDGQQFEPWVRRKTEQQRKVLPKHNAFFEWRMTQFTEYIKAALTAVLGEFKYLGHIQSLPVAPAFRSSRLDSVTQERAEKIVEAPVRSCIFEGSPALSFNKGLINIYADKSSSEQLTVEFHDTFWVVQSLTACKR